MRLAFTHCPTCKFEYEVNIKDDHDRATRHCSFRLLVMRDTCFMFWMSQAVVAMVAWLLWVLDRNGSIIRGLSKKAASSESSADAHSVFGPYYLSSLILCLAGTLCAACKRTHACSDLFVPCMTQSSVLSAYT